MPIAAWIVALLVVACQPDSSEMDNDAFRNRVLAFVRAVAAGNPDVPCTWPLTEPRSQVVVSMYHEGELLGLAASTSDELCTALQQATERVVAVTGSDRSRVATATFTVTLTDHDYALVEHQGEALELAGGTVPVRTLDKAMLRQRIDEGKGYLLRMMDPELGGVHKYYHAPTDTFEGRLHTVYTASTIYTLLALYQHDEDERLREPIERAAEFLLSMQSVVEGQRDHGAFAYSMDLADEQAQPRFVVGTTAKSIFTLIELHTLTGDPKYLDAARLAGNWLLTMQHDDGRVFAELVRRPTGLYKVVPFESMLYTGQVLSALSRLYLATGEHHFLNSATLTADYLYDKLGVEGCYLGDDYRQPNPISSSWVILSLFDYARASDNSMVREVALYCADELLTRQIDDPDDVYHHGRWRGSLSSSGNGWLAEVLSELYLDCPDQDPDGCVRYREAVVLLFRVLMQYTYSPENSFVAKNPDMARGGLFWNTLDRYVRTDSVCHAMNAYVMMIDHLPDDVLIELPEPPLFERLGLGG